MSEISSLYSSKQTVYRKSRKQSDKHKHGDIKHIVYRDGVPVLREVIRVNREDQDNTPAERQAKPKRIKADRSPARERRSSSEVLEKKRKKLALRLKNAVQKSQTLWSEREGIWISYQGRQGFLVKLFDQSNREVHREMMTQTQILEGSIPGILDTGWEIV